MGDEQDQPDEEVQAASGEEEGKKRITMKKAKSEYSMNFDEFDEEEEEEDEYVEVESEEEEEKAPQEIPKKIEADADEEVGDIPKKIEADADEEVVSGKTEPSNSYSEPFSEGSGSEEVPNDEVSPSAPTIAPKDNADEGLDNGSGRGSNTTLVESSEDGPAEEPKGDCMGSSQKEAERTRPEEPSSTPAEPKSNSPSGNAGSLQEEAERNPVVPSSTLAKPESSSPSGTPAVDLGASQRLIPLVPLGDAPHRCSYAGVLRANGTFERKFGTLEDLSAEELKQCYADIQHIDRTRSEKNSSKDAIRRKKEAVEKAKVLQRRLSEQEAEEKVLKEMQEKRKVEIRKWLATKDVEARQKRKREQAVFREVLDSEAKKLETLKERDKRDQEMRQRRVTQYRQQQIQLWGTDMRPSTAGHAGGRRSLSTPALRPHTAPATGEALCAVVERRLQSMSDADAATQSFSSNSAVFSEAQLQNASPQAAASKSQRPNSGFQELGRRTQLVKFAGCMERAHGMYSKAQRVGCILPVQQQADQDALKKKVLSERPEWKKIDLFLHLQDKRAYDRTLFLRNSSKGGVYKMARGE